MSHTPGPWKWTECGIEDEVTLAPEGYPERPVSVVLTLGWVSCGDGTRGEEPSPDDARLIAAAPELLDALEDLVERAEDAGWHHELTETAREAIKKAKGL